MDGFYRMPVLQVRDPRALSDPSDIKALKNFFDSSPPLDADPISRDVSPTSPAKSPDPRKQSRKRFFSLGKKRLSSGGLEPEPYPYGVNKSSSQSIPTGTTQRNFLGGYASRLDDTKQPFTHHLSQALRTHDRFSCTAYEDADSNPNPRGHTF
jgi:hypothetical protein